MPVENIPESYLSGQTIVPDLMVHQLQMNADAVKTRVNLNRHMFSFLQMGRKQVHIADTTVTLSSDYSVLVPMGNCLWTEWVDADRPYCCRLFFFSDEKLRSFLHAQGIAVEHKPAVSSCFVIKNDDYIRNFLVSLEELKHLSSAYLCRLLEAKLSELLIYLLAKYGTDFERYLLGLLGTEESEFKRIVLSHLYSNINVEEMAFLCHMSVSTFKRKFQLEFDAAPGKWLQERRLELARNMISKGERKPSDLYFELGYASLSNFSTAFRNRYGYSPSQA